MAHLHRMLLLVGLLPLVSLTACEGCGDDENKGTISHGTASSGVVKPPPVETERLTYNPGSPLYTTRVATLFKKRLEPLGVTANFIKIGGDIVNVDAPRDKYAAVEAALEGGRLDVYVSDNYDPFSKNQEDHTEKFKVVTEPVAGEDGEATTSFLFAPKDQREALDKYAQTYAGSKKVIIGPATVEGEEGFRNYFVRSDHSARGEFLTSAKAEGQQLVLTFEGSARSMIQWSSKEHARYVVLIDGDVVGVAEPEGTTKDGTLHVPLAPGLDAAALAKRIDGVALSHQTVKVAQD